MGTLTKNVTIEIDGDKYEDFNFLNITLSQELLKPNELRFTLQKKSLDNCMDDKDFPIPKKLMGAKVTCEIETCRFDNDDVLDEDNTETIRFEGIIFNVNIYRRSDAFSEQLFDIQAFSPDFLLMDHPHCFSYENESLKNIITATLDPYDIKNEINPRTTETIPYTVQYNETNDQFIIRLAQRYGEWMYHDGVKWYFGEIKKKDRVELDARNDVLSYHFQTELKHHKLKHAHHDYLKYENLSKSAGEFDDLTESGYHPLTDKAKEKSDELFAKETFQHLQCSNPEGNEIDEPEVSAQAQLFGEKSRQVICSGASVRADLTIGSVIAIGDHFYDDDQTHDFIFHDDMMITRIVHSTEVSGNYSNSFTAVPADSEFPPYYQHDVFPYSAAQRAVVMDNKDPEKMGRIRVQFLWQKEQDSNLMTPWIRIAQPHGGNDKGFYFIPEIEEEVMVDFENGNAEKPYVVGTLWHGQQLPSDRWYSDSNDIKAIRTRNGHTIEIRDDGDDGFIKIYDNKKENYVLTFSTDEKLIKLESTGNIELYADKNIIIAAGEDIAINAGNNMDRNVGNNDALYVSSNQTIEIGDNKEETIAEKYQLTAKTIRQEATDKLEIYGNEIEQRAGKTLKFDGGNVFDLYAKSIRMN